MANPWEFGWTQLFTAIGLVMTGIVLFLGLRTFGKYRKEKIEERRIEAAIDALALMYESRFVFDHIRNGFSQSPEWEDMPIKAGEAEAERNRRGSYYAILKRIITYRDFFERAWKLQVRCSAIFGDQTEEIFLHLQKARREVEVAALGGVALAGRPAGDVKLTHPMTPEHHNHLQVRERPLAVGMVSRFLSHTRAA
jgi:hypothetical protein